jgi:signal peptidase II
LAVTEMPMATLLVSAILLIALDQGTKALVLSSLREGQVASVRGLGIRRVMNLGGPSGLFSGRTALMALWIAAFGLVLLAVHVGPLFQHVVAQIALGMAIGGAAGNLFDRLWRGGVVDFIDLGFWPVFNVADTAIVAGTVLAMVFMR